MTIPNPIGKPGTQVMALNYRRKYNQWEQGAIVSAEYHLSGRSGGRWHYTVRLKREIPDKLFNKPIYLYLGEDKISLSQKGEE